MENEASSGAAASYDYGAEEEGHETSALEEIPVELGFAERVPRPSSEEEGECIQGDTAEYCAADIAIASEKWSSWDGGKIGGRPIWLDTNHVPDKDALTCDRCDKQMLFLMQIYAPLDEAEVGHSDAFHRMLYVFVCQQSSCVGEGSVLVLRCQLPQENDFFPSKASECHDDVLLPQLRRGLRLCRVCGCASGGESYFCEQHRSCGEHTSIAGFFCLRDAMYRYSAVLPEFEVVTEPEPPFVERKEFVRLKYQSADDIACTSQVNITDDDPDISSLTQEELLDATGAKMGADESMRYFNERISIEPEQVVRYCRWKNAVILWAGYEGRPCLKQCSIDSAAQGVDNCTECPACPYCGQERKFEFQIMPQTISFVVDAFEHPRISEQTTSLPDLDFGTIVVYTCTGSCIAGAKGYKKEYAWTQFVQ
eukprot:gb/GECG01016671.1/.p1 GENE.gb/GECG01016671.1/~~gb/GECG01016671.1/.p1  ORF type:complete len:424 (+),score=55.19 gb/GECG01016671.1/:1-1272(+)